MSQPYVGEIRMFGGNFAPAGWMFCDGSVLPISEYETLFQLIGTTFGGDGNNTFALPDLRGRIPMHQGSGPGLSTRIIGQQFGVEQVTLTASQIPAHNHALLANSQTATDTTPSATMLPSSPSPLIYNTRTPIAPMSAAAVSAVGGSQPHENRPPYLAVSFIISLYGIFPSPT